MIKRNIRVCNRSMRKLRVIENKFRNHYFLESLKNLLFLQSYRTHSLTTK